MKQNLLRQQLRKLPKHHVSQFHLGMIEKLSPFVGDRTKSDKSSLYVKYLRMIVRLYELQRVKYQTTNEIELHQLAMAKLEHQINEELSKV